MLVARSSKPAWMPAANGARSRAHWRASSRGASPLIMRSASRAPTVRPRACPTKKPNRNTGTQASTRPTSKSTNSIGPTRPIHDSSWKTQTVSVRFVWPDRRRHTLCPSFEQAHSPHRGRSLNSHSHFFSELIIQVQVVSVKPLSPVQCSTYAPFLPQPVTPRVEASMTATSS